MAISHVFSNAIPDGTNTNIVRPSDWNSAHNQYYTLSGNTLGASTVSGTNVVLQGSGNVSLSGTGQTVVVYATGGGVGGGVAIGASTQTATSGTVNFVNSNGIAFGMSGSNQITASYTVPTVPTSYVSNVNGNSGALSLAAGSSLSSSVNGSTTTFGLATNISTYLQTTGNYLTTARASNDAVGLNTAQTNVTWTVNSSGISLNASGYAGTGTSATNASVTLNSNGLAISVAAPGGGNFSAGVSTLGNTLGSTGVTGTRLVFAGVNNTLSQSTDANGGTISISAPATSSLSSGNNISISSNGSTIGISALAIGLNTAGTNVTWTANSSGLSINASGYAGTGVSTTNASVTLNSNGIAISVAAPGAANYSIGVSNLGNTAGSTGITGTRIAFVGTNNISLSQSTDANGATISINHTGAAGPTAYVSSVNGSSGAISLNVGSSLSASTNGSSITFGLASNISTYLQTTGNYLTTARASNDAVGLNTAQTNVTWTVNSSGISLNAGGYAGTGFTSTTTAGTAITASLGTNGLNMAVPLYLTAAAGGNFSAGVSNLGNTAGSTGVSGSRIVFVGTNNISLSQSTDANGATISINQTGGAGGGNVIAVTQTGGGTTAAAGTVQFATGNGISFGLDAASSVMTASYGFAVGDTNTSRAIRNLTFLTGNGITFGFASSTGASGFITASHDGLTNFNVSAGVTSNNLSNLVFSNSNNVSFGLTGSTITASAGGINAGVSTLGNTAGSTGTVSTGNVVFVGVNNITLSQSTGAAGSAATISIVGEPAVKSWAYPNPNNLTFLSNHVNASASINVIQVPFDVSGTRMDILMYQSLGSSATANTYAQAWSIYMGIYSNDTANSRIYSLSSGSTQTTYTVASNTAGVTQLNGSGVRPVSCPVNFTMTEGQYAMVANWVTTASSIGTATTALAQTLSVVGNPIQSASMAIVPEYDVATAATNAFTMPMGMLNVASTGIPASISYSQINMTGLSRLRANFFVAMRG